MQEGIESKSWVEDEPFMVDGSDGQASTGVSERRGRLGSLMVLSRLYTDDVV